MSLSLNSAARAMIPSELSAVVVSSLLHSSALSVDPSSLSAFSSNDAGVSSPEARERSAMLVFRVLQNICISGRHKDALLKLLLRAVSGDQEGVLLAEREMRIENISNATEGVSPVGMTAVIVSFSF